MLYVYMERGKLTLLHSCAVPYIPLQGCVQSISKSQNSDTVVEDSFLKLDQLSTLDQQHEVFVFSPGLFLPLILFLTIMSNLFRGFLYVSSILPHVK